MTVKVTYFTDPACPWAYSASPALAAVRWRFGDQLEWRTVMIGLVADVKRFESSSFTPTMMVRRRLEFRDRFGMPFITQARERHMLSVPGCRAVVATRLQAPDREYAVYRALQFGWMTTTLETDTPEGIRAAIADVPGIDADAVASALDTREVDEAYEQDRALARTAGGSPTEAMGRSANSDGAVRYTAPSLVFELDGRRLDAGGFQPLESYDVCLANLAPQLERRPAAASAAEALAAFPDGLTSQEVAAVMTERLSRVDRDAAVASLVEAVAEGRARRQPLADDALWLPAG